MEEICALAQRLRQIPSPGQLAAVFDDGRRIEGDLVSGWRGSGVPIARGGPARPGVRCLLLDGSAADPAPQSDALLEFHNGDRIRGTICGYVAASTAAGQSVGAQVLVQPSQDSASPRRNPSPWKSIGCGGSCSTRPGRRAAVRRGRSSAATGG